MSDEREREPERHAQDSGGRMLGAGTAFPILCAGLPRSASTWAFNAAASLGCLSGKWPQVAMFYSDGIGGSHDEEMLRGGLLLIKTHSPSPLLCCAVLWSGAPVLLTIRDPRDCVVSLMQQFGFAFADAVRAISASAAALLRLEQAAAPLLLRYEDRVAFGLDGINRIAEFLHLDIPRSDREQIACELSRERVGQFVDEAKFVNIPGEPMPLPQSRPETQWHPNHIGDGLIGKYNRLLTPAQIAVVNYETREFRRRFGYASHAEPAALAPGVRTVFSVAGTGANYLGEGFSYIEDWGVWTQAEAAFLELRLECPVAEWLSLEIDCMLGPSFQPDGSSAEISVNGQRRAVIAVSDARPEQIRLAIWLQDASVVGSDRIRLDLHITKPLSPAQLGLTEDTRPIGVGLRTISVDYR